MKWWIKICKDKKDQNTKYHITSSIIWVASHYLLTTLGHYFYDVLKFLPVHTHNGSGMDLSLKSCIILKGSHYLVRHLELISINSRVWGQSQDGCREKNTEIEKRQFK